MSTPLVSYEIPTDREDLSDMLSVLEQYDTPLLDRVMDGGKACTNSTHQWVNKKLFGLKGFLVSDATAGATSITVSGESELGIPLKYLIYQVLEIDDEQMQITAAPVANGSNWDVTVTRGYASTTAAAHSANDEIDVIDRPLPEGFVPNESEHQFGSKDQNITQIFGGYVSLSRTSRSIDVAGSDNNIATQINDVLKLKKKELEKAAIRGRTAVDGSGDNRRMKGLAGFLNDSDFTVDAGGNDLDVDVLDQAIEEQLSIGAKPNVIFCSIRQKFKFNALKVERVRQAQPQSDKSINNLVDVYMSEAGELPIVSSFDVKSDEIFLLDTNKVKVVPLQRSAFAMTDQGKEGMNERKYLEGEYTMELRNPEAHRRITNLAR